jgi:hypothetical protein
MLAYNGTGLPQIISFNVTNLTTGHYYNFKLYSMNTIFLSSTYATTQVLIATVPGRPAKPEFVAASIDLLTITISWKEPSYIGGIPIFNYKLWIDNGAGTWSTTPVTYTPSVPGSSYTYTFTGLTASGNYQFKVTAVNLIGDSLDSEISYFQCAGVPDAPGAPAVEKTTETSISVAWN